MLARTAINTVWLLRGAVVIEVVNVAVVIGIGVIGVVGTVEIACGVDDKVVAFEVVLVFGVPVILVVVVFGVPVVLVVVVFGVPVVLVVGTAVVLLDNAELGIELLKLNEVVAG